MWFDRETCISRIFFGNTNILPVEDYIQQIEVVIWQHEVLMSLNALWEVEEVAF